MFRVAAQLYCLFVASLMLLTCAAKKGAYRDSLVVEDRDSVRKCIRGL